LPACACQQEEAKRPKSPKREDAQLVEQHGSGGEGGDWNGERKRKWVEENKNTVFAKWVEDWQLSAVRNVRASGVPCIARLRMRMHVVLADLRTQQRTPVGQKEGG
jgi:hypothetical protein